jgi:dienelactone hydrolase
VRLNLFGPVFAFPIFLLLLFLGVMFWAKSQDPFSRRWFSLKTADHGSFQCVAVLPKPLRRVPVIVYAHGAGGTLMRDGNDLRQMAELGLAAVSLDFNETNEAAFHSQWAALLQYLGRQPWADPNAMAWVGFSLGAQRTMRLAESGGGVSPLPPQLLVQISGDGLGPLPAGAPAAASVSPVSAFRLPYLSGRQAAFRFSVLLIHGEQDEVFPVADTQRLADCLGSNGVPVTLRILPGLSHNLDPERAVVFRGVGEYCLTQLAGPDAWRNYHSIAQWQAEAPALGWFWIPALVWAGAVMWRRQAEKQKFGKQKAEIEAEEFYRKERMERKEMELVSPISPSAGGSETGRVQLADGLRVGKPAIPQTGKSAVLQQPSADGEIGAVRQLCPAWIEKFGRRSRAVLPWVAGILAALAVADSAVHLGPQHFPVGDRTLDLARRFLVQPKERADFEWLAAQPVWSGVKLRVLLDHVELAVYNRELINWTLDETMYRDFVLWPVTSEKQKFGKSYQQKAEMAEGGGQGAKAEIGLPAGQAGKSGNRETEARARGEAQGGKLESGIGGENEEPKAVETAGVAGALMPHRAEATVLMGDQGKEGGMDWRRPLWEEFYPRIRHESSPGDAARIVARHLHERVTVTTLADPPRTVPEIWRRQITDAPGFEVIYVAALRSVGVPARLHAQAPAEYWDGAKWQERRREE